MNGLEIALVLFIIGGVTMAAVLGYLIGGQVDMYMIRRLAQVEADREELARQLAEAEAIIARVTQGSTEVLDAVPRAALGAHHRPEEGPRG